MENLIEENERLSLMGGVAWCPLNQEGWDKRPQGALRENVMSLSEPEQGAGPSRSKRNLQTSTRTAVKGGRRAERKSACFGHRGVPPRASLPPTAEHALGAGSGAGEKRACSCLVAETQPLKVGSEAQVRL